jgi:hypothetical protein
MSGFEPATPQCKELRPIEINAAVNQPMTDIGLELASLDHALGMAIGFAGKMRTLISRSNSFTKLAQLDPQSLTHIISAASSRI